MCWSVVHVHVRPNKAVRVQPTAKPVWRAPPLRVRRPEVGPRAGRGPGRAPMSRGTRGTGTPGPAGDSDISLRSVSERTPSPISPTIRIVNVILSRGPTSFIFSFELCISTRCLSKRERYARAALPRPASVRTHVTRSIYRSTSRHVTLIHLTAARTQCVHIGPRVCASPSLSISSDRRPPDRGSIVLAAADRVLALDR